MIFCGDFTFPSNYSKNIFSNLDSEFLQKPKIINFESTIDEFNKRKKTNGIALKSSKEAIIALKHLNVICTSHANNHVTDYDYNPKIYLEYFSGSGIKTLGIGKNIEEASQPFIYSAEKLIVLSYGWETIRCKAATRKNFGVNPYRYKSIEKQVKLTRLKYPDYRIILFCHWNYEFENYPLPADRQFSHHMIDLGVDGIFGHHPHIINGYEIYKNKPIFYSLGNFYFPQVKYGKHQLNFRDTALDGISVEYNGNLNDLKIYHHTQDKKGTFLKLEGCYKLGEFEKLNQLSSFSKLDHKSYIKFYKKNHFHKNKLLPIYKNFDKPFTIACYNLFVKLRQIPIDILTKLKH